MSCPCPWPIVVINIIVRRTFHVPSRTKLDFLNAKHYLGSQLVVQKFLDNNGVRYFPLIITQCKTQFWQLNFMPKYSFDNLILCTLHCTLWGNLLYCMLEFPCNFDFFNFSTNQNWYQIRTDKNKNFQMGQYCSRLYNLEFENWLKSKNFVA